MLVRSKKASSPVTLTIDLPPNPDAAREKIEHEAAIALCSNVRDTASSRDQYAVNKAYESCRGTLTDYSSETVRSITHAAQGHLGTLLLRVVSEDKPTQDFINDLLIFEPFAREQGLRRNAPILMALGQYDNLALPTDPERRYQQVTAILRATNHLNDLGYGVVATRDKNWNKLTQIYLKDSALRHLITAHKHPGLVADIIIERDLSEIDEIKELLGSMGNGAPAMSSGAL